MKNLVPRPGPGPNSQLRSYPAMGTAAGKQGVFLGAPAGSCEAVVPNGYVTARSGPLPVADDRAGPLKQLPADAMGKVPGR